MIFSAAVVVSVLSLLSSTRAATIRARQDGCTFVCPDKDLGGNALYASTTSDAVISCSYVGQPLNSCTYDWVSHIPPPRRRTWLTLLFRLAERLLAKAIALSTQLNNVSHVEGLLTPTPNGSASATIRMCPLQQPRFGLRTIHPHPGAAHRHLGVHLHPSPSPAIRLRLHSHATSDAPCRTLGTTC